MVTRGKRSTIPAAFSDTLAPVVEADRTIKPAQAVAQCRSILEDTGGVRDAEFRREKTLRPKLSNLKAAMKGKEKGNLM